MTTIKMQEHSPIKAIIFDLGGVIININYNLTRLAFEKLGAHDFHKIYSQSQQTSLFDEFETGKINTHVFRNRLKTITKLQHITDAEIDKAWNAMLLDLPKYRLDFIRNIKKSGFKTFLFSNTNEIHLQKMFEISKKMTGYDNFSEVFEKEYYSHLCHFRKPHKSSFDSILQDNHLNANEVLFIDDSIQHIEGANLAGINTYFLGKDEVITDLKF